MVKVFKKEYTVFSLDAAVDGIGNEGVYRDESTFNLFSLYSSEEEKECEKFIENRIQDHLNRGYTGGQYVILPVYYTNAN